jgi:hypothetical protein
MFQENFYRYNIENRSKSLQCLLVSGIVSLLYILCTLINQFYLTLGVFLSFYAVKKNARSKQMELDQDNAEISL